MDENIEINVLFKNENYQETYQYAREKTEYFKVLLKEHKLEELEKQLNYEKNICAHDIKKEYFEKNIHFVLGEYIGELNSLYEQLKEKYEEIAIKDLVYKSDIIEIPHVNDIISTIYHDEGIRHGVLAEKIGIDRSTLTGIMDKLVIKQVVIFSRPGKFKHYYLTNLGKKYYSDQRDILESNSKVDVALEQLLINLSKEENKTKIIQDIIPRVFEQNSKIKGHNNKKQKIDPTSLLVYFANQKPMNVMISNSNEVHKIVKTFNIRKDIDEQTLVFCENANSSFKRKLDLYKTV